MAEWYHVAQDVDGRLTITFSQHPKKRWFSPSVLQEFALEDAADRSVVLTGPGAVWMYFHAAYLARRKRAECILVHNVDGTETPVFPLPVSPWLTWCSFCDLASDEEQVIEFIGEEVASDQLCSLPLREGRPLRIGGRGAVWMYAAAGAQAGEAVDVVVYDAPREDRLISIGGRQPGLVLPRRATTAEQGLIVGVAGDPNSGKSVFVRGLYEAIRCHVKRCWAFDCDAASPTPNWYLLLLGNPHVDPSLPGRLRAGYKVEWTPQLEQEVGQQLRTLKHNLALTLADLPGGVHPKPGQTFAPDRIPATRKTMFDPIDWFIILGRKDRPEAAAGWRAALTARGYGSRIIGELTSCDPQAQPHLSQLLHQGSLLQGEVCGLDRKRPREEVARALEPVAIALLDALGVTA